MNKIIMGLIVAVCVLGMALIMLNEKLGRKPEPAPATSLESPSATPSTTMDSAALPSGESGGGTLMPSLPAPTPPSAVIPAPELPAVPAFSFGGEDMTPPTPPPLPQTAPPLPVLPRKDAPRVEAPLPSPASPAAPPPDEERREVPVPSLPSSVVAEHERKASPSPVRQEPSEKTPEKMPEKKAPEKTTLPPAPETPREKKTEAETPRRPPLQKVEREKEEPRKKEPAPVKEKPSSTGKSVDRFVVYARDGGATVRIVGNANISYKPMLLTGPDRVVLDLDGDWDIKAPGIPKNKLVTNIRIGKLNGKTRIVIDLNSTAKIRYTLSRDRRMLDVRADK